MASVVGQIVSTNDGALTPSTIPGIANGDTLVLIAVHRLQGAYSVQSSNSFAPAWTTVGLFQHASGTLQINAWMKPYAALAESIWINSASGVTLLLYALRGLDLTTQLDVGVSTSGSGTTSEVTPGLTTVTDKALILHAIGAYSATATPSITSAFGAALTSNRANARADASVYSLTQSPAGATGDATATASTATQMGGLLMAFRPSPDWPAGDTENVTAGATVDVVQGVQSFGDRAENVQPAVSQDAAFVAPQYGADTENVQAGAAQDAAVIPTTPVGDAAVGLGAAQDAGVGGAGAASAAATLGAQPDAAIANPGDVTFPDAGSWQVVVPLPAAPTPVTVSDSLGAVIRSWLNPDGTLSPWLEDQHVGLGATQDATTIHIGNLADTVHPDVQADAVAQGPGQASADLHPGVAQDAAVIPTSPVAAPVTAGATQDAVSLPAAALDWLARFVVSGLSWVAGPYATPLLDLLGLPRQENVQVGVQQDAQARDYGDTGAGVGLGAQQEGAFGPAYNVAAQAGAHLGVVPDAAFAPYVELLAPISVRCSRYAALVRCARLRADVLMPRRSVLVRGPRPTTLVKTRRYALTLTAGRR